MVGKVDIETTGDVTWTTQRRVLNKKPTMLSGGTVC